MKIMASGPITPWQIRGETVETVRDFIFWAPKSLQMVTAAMKLKDICFLEEKHIKKQRHYFANKGSSSQSYGFSSSHGWMWELDHKESWAPKNWCFWTVVLEKTLWTAKNSVGLRGDQTNQSWSKSFLNIHWKDWCWHWNSNTLATWCRELTLWKRPWSWKRLKAGGEDRGWAVWMASLTRWTWVWARSESWWWNGKPGVLQSMELQWGWHDWGVELTDGLGPAHKQRERVK